MKLAAYIRVSTDYQAEHGAGLDVQREAIRSWAKIHGHRVAVWTADEGVSGSNGLDCRVGLLDAVDALSAGRVQGIVVYRLDRLARDLVLQESLLAEAWRLGGRVFSTSASEDAYLDPDGADMDPSRALIRQVLGAVSQYERAMIRLRLRAGKIRKAQQGGYIGGPAPLGYRNEAKGLVADEDEQATLRRIADLHSEGASLRRICEHLTAEGRHTKRGGQWHARSVSRIIQRLSA